MQTIPLRQSWPEDMVLVIKPNVHIYICLYINTELFKSVYKRGRLMDRFHGKCSDTDKRRKISEKHIIW